MTYDPSNPDSINPTKWNRGEAFYFDGEIALMMGHYDGSSDECVGMRWMVAEGPLGYPVTRGYPQWMVTPDKLALYMLEGIDEHENDSGTIRNPIEFRRVLDVLRERVRPANNTADPT